MCTLILSVSAAGRWPVLIGSTRDEFRARGWEGPAEWWPQEHPGVIGGRDLEAGGTWMAVSADARRWRWSSTGSSRAPSQTGRREAAGACR